MSSLASIARYRLGHYLKDREPETVPGLLDFIPRTTPSLEAPTWMGELVDILERADREQLFVVSSFPPQVGKSETILHDLAKAARYRPDLTNAYVTYAADLAHKKSAKARRYARESGVRFGETNTQAEWRTVEDGGLLATGIGGPLTGQRVDGKLILDDPIKNREEAESRVMRDKAWDWITDVGLTRMHPGASAILNMTRWHPDDPAGRAIEAGWVHVCVPAVRDGVWDPAEKRFISGESINAAKWSLDFWSDKRRRVGEYTWASLYQGEPRRRGGSVFDPPTTCLLRDVPPMGRHSRGIDLAYSAKTYSNYSVTLTLRQYDSRIYVVDVVRRQARAEDFLLTLKAHQSMVPGAVPRWYCSGTEQGVASLLGSHGVAVDARNATADKFVRAQPAALAWNAGEIIVPTDAPWSAEFVDEVRNFTGVGDKEDDQVDALAAAYDALVGGASGKIDTFDRGTSQAAIKRLRNFY